MSKLKFYRVFIERRVRGYVVVQAPSPEAAEQMASSGTYGDVFGEDICDGIEVLFAELDDQ